jgi:outer membrane protein OmpA-like peptidoglycan-associated protein
MPRYLQGQPVTVSQPTDASEQHAERVAADVMSGAPCAACARGLPCASCGGAVERSAEGHAPSASVSSAPALGGGQPLHHDARTFFEPRFGRDLGGVRVHADEHAGELARDFSARAFATGRDIVFAPGEYEPATDSGRRLLAHELAHVLNPRESGRIARVPDAGVDAGVTDAGVPALPGGVPAPPVPALPAGTPAPALPATPPASMFDTLYGTCPTPAEATRRDAFALRHLHLDRNIPSTTFGMFDADYFPFAGALFATVRIKFNFVDADNTPDFWGLIARLGAGLDVRQFFWSDTEKADFKRDYINRVTARWSGQHAMASTKPCWPFRAASVVTPIEASTDAAAHYVATVHKSPGPGFDYKSSTNDPNVARPDLPATADLYSSDVRENPDFNSRDVATSERRRFEAALTASGASPVLFDKDRDVIKPAARTALTVFATALKQKNPSDPLIPLKLDAFASSEGELVHNTGLADRRGVAVRDLLTTLGVSQPMGVLGHGPVGAANDAANRKVDITVDHAFEAAYASNRYSVGEHEFGHMLGLPDEYQNNTTGILGTQQTLYMGLVTTAGVQGPAVWGTRTSSQMASGVDVLPRHYVTLWEALGRMTTPDITQGEWSLR